MMIVELLIAYPLPAVDPGDINGDGTIDAFNYRMVKAHVLGTYRI